MVVDAQQLLFALNEYLSRTALLVQPLCLPAGAAAAAAAASASRSQLSDAPPIVTIDVPLPLTLLPKAVPAGSGGAASGTTGGGGGSNDSWNPFGVAAAPGGSGSSGGGGAPDKAVGYLPSGDAQEVALPPGLPAALQQLGLGGALGYVRLLQEPEAAAAAAGDDAQPAGVASEPAAAQQAEQREARWVPLALWLGMPMTPSQLCRAVCSAAQAAGFLDPPVLAAQRAGQATLAGALAGLAARHGACSTAFAGGGRDDDLGCYVDRPTRNLAFEAGRLAVADLGAAVEGVPLLLA